MSFNYLELFTAALPETIVAVAGFLVLLLDFAALREEPNRVRAIALSSFAIAGCAAGIAWISFSPPDNTSLSDGLFALSPLTQLVKQVILGLTILTVLISLQRNFTDHLGEYYLLLLLASSGMMFLVSAENILGIFVALELISLSLYILTAFNKASLFSSEAALKYFLFGGMSAAFTLFGLSLLYGVTGALNLGEIAAHLAGQTADPLFYVGLVMTVIGFGFKIAAAPFHLWAPDAYQGAPTPVASFIAAGSKVASFFILAKLMFVGFAGATGSAAWHQYAAGWTPIIAAVAALSMVIGNVAAIAQTSVKRLLAYSAVAHAGYALLGILANGDQGLSSLLYYVITYGLTVVGAFAVVSAVEGPLGEKLSDFAGLNQRAPLLSFCMLIFVLSLAGIPPLAGFFGKFYLFTAAVGSDPKQLGLLWLVILAIGTSVVSLYYYLQILKQIYVVQSCDVKAIEVSWPTTVAIILIAIAVVLFGCLPNLILSRIVSAI